MDPEVEHHVHESPWVMIVPAHRPGLPLGGRGLRAGYPAGERPAPQVPGARLRAGQRHPGRWHEAPFGATTCILMVISLAVAGRASSWPTLLRPPAEGPAPAGGCGGPARLYRAISTSGTSTRSTTPPSSAWWSTGLAGSGAGRRRPHRRHRQRVGEALGARRAGSPGPLQTGRVQNYAAGHVPRRVRHRRPRDHLLGRRRGGSETVEFGFAEQIGFRSTHRAHLPADGGGPHHAALHEGPAKRLQGHRAGDLPGHLRA